MSAQNKNITAQQMAGVTRGDASHLQYQQCLWNCLKVFNLLLYTIKTFDP